MKLLNNIHGIYIIIITIIVLTDCKAPITKQNIGLDAARKIQESLANAKVSARQQCVYEGP